MTTASRLAANRLNAARSTGPRTAAGKRRASQNARTHGLTTTSPVVPGEDAAAWETFRQAVLADHRPRTALEAELVDRLAALQWRLRRVLAVEVAAATDASLCPWNQPARVSHPGMPCLKACRERLQDEETMLADTRRRAALVAALAHAADGDRVSPRDATAVLSEASARVPDPHRPPLAVDDPADLVAADAPDGREEPVAVDDPEWADATALDAEYAAWDRLLVAAGVPESCLAEPARWDGWTAGAVRAGLAAVAARAGVTVSQVLGTLGGADFAFLERRVADARAVLAPLEAVERGRTAIPPEAALAAVLRYEPHLSKQVTQVLDQLARLRALRRG